MRSLGSETAIKTRLPRAASATASAAVSVVFPVPPLPVTNKNRRWSRGTVVGKAGRVLPQSHRAHS